MRVLIVEDDKKIASFIIKGLKQEGFAVDHATNGEDGLHLAQTWTFLKRFEFHRQAISVGTIFIDEMFYLVRF